MRSERRTPSLHRLSLRTPAQRRQDTLSKSVSPDFARFMPKCQHMISSQQETGGTMTHLLHSDHKAEDGSVAVDRRNLLRGAAGIAATALTVKSASAASVAPL